MHACGPGDLSRWIAAELWQVELGGAVVAAPHKLVAERGRLLRRLRAWDEEAAAALASACAGRAAPSALAADATRFAATAALGGPGAFAAAATACYVAAHAAADLSGDPAGFDAERGWQGSWIAARAGLAG